jgi:hypothetical protein
MSLFKNMPLIKRSFVPGTRVKGTWVEGTQADTNFKGTAQPASGRVLELLPEGKRNTETISVFAPITLDFITADPELQRSGDIIIWEGRQYEVQTARKWAGGILPHWELVATRVKEGQA